MVKFVFLAVAITALIHSAQADCSCSWCSSNGGKFPDTCLTTGCTAPFFLTNLTAIDPYTGLICATNKCFVGGSCPSYSQSGSVLASSTLADEYTGAFASNIGTACLDDVCWFNKTTTCPTGSCLLDSRFTNPNFGVWCVTTGNICPSGFAKTVALLPAYCPTPAEVAGILGSVIERVGCVNLTNICAMKVDPDFS